MPSIIARPTAGPSAIATAAARFNSTTGDGVIRWSAPYSAAIWAQSVSAGVAASSCSAAIAAWSWYGPGRRAARARSTSARPSAIACRVPARSVLVVEQDQLPGRPDAGLAPGVVEQHQCQQPGRLGLVGEQRDHDPCQPDRLGAQLPADQRVARRRRVSLVEHQVEDAQDPVEPFGQELGRRDAIGDPGVADLALGPDQALGKGRLGDEERPGDLRAWSGRPACAASAPPARPARAPGGSR